MAGINFLLYKKFSRKCLKYKYKDQGEVFEAEDY